MEQLMLPCVLNGRNNLSPGVYFFISFSMVPFELDLKVIAWFLKALVVTRGGIGRSRKKRENKEDSFEYWEMDNKSNLAGWKTCYDQRVGEKN